MRQQNYTRKHLRRKDTRNLCEGKSNPSFDNLKHRIIATPAFPLPPNILIQTHLTQYFQVGIILFNVIHETQIFLRV